MVNLRIFSDTDSLHEINKNGNLSNKQWNKIGKLLILILAKDLQPLIFSLLGVELS